jgi:hypothetical protein
MKAVLRNQAEQVKLIPSGKMTHLSNQEMPTRLQKEESIMQIGLEL